MARPRKIKTNTVYKHFLYGDKYATMEFFSKPITFDELKEAKHDIVDRLSVKHTETGGIIFIYSIWGNYSHLKEDEEEDLVLYKDLFSDNKHNETSILARPLSIFASLTDKEKYPNSKQKYRFEEI